MGNDRHSEVDEPDLISDPDEKAFIEARNALRQFDVGMVLLDHWLDNKVKPRLRISDLLYLNRFALEDVNRFAGTFRTQPVTIHGSSHRPPEPRYVPELCEDFCDYINENWEKKSAIHLSAYTLWRINWIHPFADGNGRTSRVLSYVILCAKYGFRLPGLLTIPEQIVADKQPYYAALEAADLAFQAGKIGISSVENLVEKGLAKQLETVRPEKEKASSTGPGRAVEQGDLLVLDPAKTQKILLTVKVDPSQKDSNFIERNPTVWAGVFSLVSVILGLILGKFI